MSLDFQDGISEMRWHWGRNSMPCIHFLCVFVLNGCQALSSLYLCVPKSNYSQYAPQFWIVSSLCRMEIWT